MGRKTAIFATLVVACSTVSMLPASAATSTPVTGKISCAINGTTTFAPAVPDINSDGFDRKIRLKLKANIGPCVNNDATGGKAPITGGTLQINAFVSEFSTCWDFIGSVPDVFSYANKVKVKWTGTTSNGKATKVAGSQTDLLDLEPIAGGWQLTTDPFDPTHSDGFANESASIILKWDAAGLTNLGACVAGTSGLRSLSFSSGAGSTITVQP